MALPTTTPSKRAPRPPLSGPRGVVSAVVVAVVIAEVLLRALFGFGNPRIVETDARLGYRFYPGQTIPGPQGTTEHLNSAGYRDVEWAQRAGDAAPHGIAVLGASVPYGPGVEDGGAWPALAGAELEVFNFAMPGYVLEQFARQYEDDVRLLRPAIVILELSAHSIRLAPVRTDSLRYPGHTFVRRSAIYDVLRRRGDIAGAAERAVVVHRAPEKGTDPALWQEAEARLDELVDSMRSDGVRLVLLETPLIGAVLAEGGEHSRWDTWAARQPDVVRLRTTEALRVEMASVLEELAQRELDPGRVWTRAAEPVALENAADNLFFQDDPLHLTERGHRVMARIVLEGLRDAGLR